MTKQVTTLLAEDLSAVGNISTTEALPILTAFGYRTTVLPTTLLSAQTEGLGVPARLDTTEWMEHTNQHWQTIAGMTFDQALVGYVGSVAGLQALKHVLQTWEPPLVVLDPAFGDNGQIYPGLDERYVAAMRTILPLGTVVTPNLTELEMLSDTVVDPNDDQSIQTALTTLTKQLSPNAQVVVTGVGRGNQIGSLWLAAGQLRSRWVARLPRHYSGAGDAYAALLTGYLGRNLELGKAVEQTMATMGLALTATNPDDYSSGLNLVSVLRAITQGKNKE